MNKALKLSAYVASEVELHEAVADALDLLLRPPAMWTTLAVGHFELTGQQGAKLARLGVKPSFPDLIVIHHGIYGIELKRAGGCLSRSRTVRTRRGTARVIAGQVEVFPRLIAAGMRIAVCHSVEEVLAAVDGWDIPRAGRVKVAA